MKQLQWSAVFFVGFLWMFTACGQDITSEAGSDWRCYPLLGISTNAQDNTLRLQTNTLVELRGGLNRFESGKWVKCAPQLRMNEDGSAVGEGARHSVHFAQNLNTAGALEIKYPGSSGPEVLRMHLLGLFYEDTSLGTNVMIADVQDSAAQVVGEHVHYADALTGPPGAGILGDVSYGYTISGLSQQVLLRSALPDPAIYGLSPASVVLVAISEIIDGPEPQIEVRRWEDRERTEVDQTLNFGNLSMTPGWAFRLGSAPEELASLPVSKEYRTTASGRRIILERVDFAPIQKQLLLLPPASQNTNGTASLKVSRARLVTGGLPVRPQNPKIAQQSPIAPDSLASDGIVMDWDLVHTTLKDVTFRRAPGVSYLITGDTHLGGSTTINPAAVLRFEAGSLFIDGDINLPSVPDGMRKPVITSVFDETVGPPLRSGRASIGQSTPALVVRNRDYTNAVRLIESRHPGARLVPERPAGVPRVQIRKAKGEDGDGVNRTIISVHRSGGKLDRPLSVSLTAKMCTGAGATFSNVDLTATIPANSDRVEVPVGDIASSAPTNCSSFILIVNPEPTGAYVPSDQLDASLSLSNSGTISPLMVQVPAALTGWWKAEGNANDSSDGSRNGTMCNGASWGPGWVGGQAFSFDGVDDYMQVADDPLLRPTPLTLEFWVKRQRVSGAYEYLIEKGGDWMGGLQSYALQIHGSDNDLCFTWNNGYRMAGVISDLNWHHCAVTAENGQTDPVLYIDGWPQTITLRSGSWINMNTSSSGPLHVGAQYDTSWKYYGNTLIDELSIYS